MASRTIPGHQPGQSCYRCSNSPRLLSAPHQLSLKSRVSCMCHFYEHPENRWAADQWSYAQSIYLCTGTTQSTADRPEGYRSVMPNCLYKASKPKHVRMEETMAWCFPHHQGHICGQTCQRNWKALVEATHWGCWKEMSCHSHDHCHFKNIFYPKLPQIIPKLYALLSVQPPLNYSPGAERKTLCKTQLWGRESHGQRVCGKPKFHALWKPKSQVTSLKIFTKRLTHTKHRNQSPSFSWMKRIKLNLNLAVFPLGAGHVQPHVTSWALTDSVVIVRGWRGC